MVRRVMSKTKRIRIAVAISHDGTWNATGWWDDNYSGLTQASQDAQGAEAVVENQERSSCNVVFVEADVPLPIEGVTVEGKVSQ